MSDTRTILDFLALSEQLKCELRHSWLSNGQQESVAEHCWQMALMALVTHRKLEQPVDIDRTLKMILTHDLVEAITGDVPFFEQGERRARKVERENAAIDEIRGLLGEPVGQAIHELWHEYEAKESAEAKFATALDHLEVQIQHNLADLETWTPFEYELVYTKMDAACAHDRFLAGLCEGVKADAEAKMRAGGVDVDAIKRRLGVPA